MIEPAPFTLPSRYVLDLRSLAQHAQQDAQDALPRIADEVTHRLPPNVHRYELLARNQHVATLASYVAAVLEEAETGPTNPPLAVAENAVRSYRATHLHTSRPVGDVLNRALDGAIDRVLDSVRTTQAEDDERARYEAEQDEQVAEYERRYEQ